MLSSQKSLLYLWVTAALNFLVGGIIWFSQREELDSYSPDPEAFAWSAIGTNLMGFGILVAVVALAAEAIVGAIEENSKPK
jgi:hypothetical protein